MAQQKNAKHERFAAFVAAGLSATAAYIKAGYSDKSANGAEVSASRLLRNAKVGARIAELSKRVVEGVIKAEIGKRNDRVAALNERWHLMRQVISERAADARYRAQQAAEKAKKDGKPAPAPIPGDMTGLLVRRARSVGSGKAATVIVEYEVDTGTLKELRGHEQQAAQELGQWTEKTDSTVRFPALKDATEDEIRAMLADLGDQESADAGATPGAGQKAASSRERRTLPKKP